MVEQPKSDEFAHSDQTSLSMASAIAKARLAIGAITSAPVDGVKNCNRRPDKTWSATIEVVESAARMGDNDLISAYELIIDPSGEMLEFQRVGRYHREDAGSV